jgi:hypothetical protein
MRIKSALALGFSLFTLSGAATAGCQFSYRHYGEPQTFKLIEKGIGSKVTDQYCVKYSKTHEIVLISNEYVNTKGTMAHASVGLRKRGSKELPSMRRSAYQYEEGNFVVAKGYEMGAKVSLDTLMDVMSDLDTYAN